MQLKEVFFKISFLYNFLSVKFLMNLTNKKYIHVFYHFIEDDKNKVVNKLYRAKNKKQFKEDLLFLKQNFVPLNIDNFKNSDKKKLGFLISFDDGLSNFNNVVVPILLDESLTAINFLNSDFLNNKALFYRYKVNLLLNKLEKKVFSKVQKRALLNLFKKHGIKKKITCFLNEATIKDVLILEEIAEIMDLSFNSFLKKEMPYLTDTQILEIQSKGFYFGAHSKSHPRFSEISLSEQIKETLESVAIIKKQFNLRKKFFSFPFSDNGVTRHFFNEMKSKDIITFGSSGLKDEDLKNHHQRIQMEYKKKIYSAETIVKGELIYYLFKRLLSKHRTVRVS